MNRKKLRLQCPECGRAGGAHHVYCGRIDEEVVREKQAPDKHRDARKYFAQKEAESEAHK